MAPLGVATPSGGSTQPWNFNLLLDLTTFVSAVSALGVQFWFAEAITDGGSWAGTAFGVLACTSPTSGQPSTCDRKLPGSSVYSSERLLHGEYPVAVCLILLIFFSQIGIVAGLKAAQTATVDEASRAVPSLSTAKPELSPGCGLQRYRPQVRLALLASPLIASLMESASFVHEHRQKALTAECDHGEGNEACTISMPSYQVRWGVGRYLCLAVLMLAAGAEVATRMFPSQQPRLVNQTSAAGPLAPESAAKADGPAVAAVQKRKQKQRGKQQ